MQLSDPFNPTTQRLYTGQISDQQTTGLYYYNARYYNPLLAKFTQADTTNDQLNRYSYVSNNPIILTDPSGNQQNGDDSDKSSDKSKCTDWWCFLDPNVGNRYTPPTMPPPSYDYEDVMLWAKAQALAGLTVLSGYVNILAGVGVQTYGIEESIDFTACSISGGDAASCANPMPATTITSHADDLANLGNDFAEKLGQGEGYEVLKHYPKTIEGRESILKNGLWAPTGRETLTTVDSPFDIFFEHLVESGELQKPIEFEVPTYMVGIGGPNELDSAGFSRAIYNSVPDAVRDAYPEIYTLIQNTPVLYDRETGKVLQTAAEAGYGVSWIPPIFIKR